MQRYWDTLAHGMLTMYVEAVSLVLYQADNLLMLVIISDVVYR